MITLPPARGPRDSCTNGQFADATRGVRKFAKFVASQEWDAVNVVQRRAWARRIPFVWWSAIFCKQRQRWSGSRIRTDFDSPSRLWTTNAPLHDASRCGAVVSNDARHNIISVQCALRVTVTAFKIKEPDEICYRQKCVCPMSNHVPRSLCVSVCVCLSVFCLLVYALQHWQSVSSKSQFQFMIQISKIFDF